MDWIKRVFKKLFDPGRSMRLTLFNIVTLTTLVGAFISFLVMLVGQFGKEQMPGLLLTLLVLIVCSYLANSKNKLNLASGIIIAVITFILFPIMYFTGGAINSGMPIYFALGTIFLFMIVDGAVFYILLVIQFAVYTACFVLSYLHPEWVTTLGSSHDIYVDIFQSLMVVGLVIGLINKFQTRTYENLLKKINEQNQALVESEKNAESANRAKSDFLSNMSHEIRTPINAIIGLNEMIQRDVQDEEIQGYSSAIHNSAKALLSIINDILDISKIESGKMDIINKKYDLATLVIDSYHMVSDRATEKGLQLLVRCDQTLPKSLNGDLIRVRQIIVNLLTNAVKYTDEGTVTFTVSGEETDQKFKLKISVSDTGIGMKQESIEKLFDKFERFDLTHNQSIEGTGLGLNIVKELLTLMDGDITVFSEYGSGSTFTVIIPQEIEDNSPVGKVDLNGWYNTNSQEKYKPSIVAPWAKVLVVDDVEINQVVFKKLIKQTEIQVDTASSGKQCIAMIKKEKYNIIFMDHMMPDMNGIETFERMQSISDNKNKNTPVIMLTANAIVGMDEEYRNIGFSDYLPKPIDSILLEELIRKYLGKDQLERENTVEKVVPVEKEEKEEKKELDVKDQLNDLKTKIPEIDIEKGIKSCGADGAFYLQIVKLFCSEGEIENLKKYYDEKDWKNYAIVIHAVKGTLKTIGLPEDAKNAESMQFAAEKENVDFIDAIHEDMLERIVQLQNIFMEI